MRLLFNPLLLEFKVCQEMLSCYLAVLKGKTTKVVEKKVKISQIEVNF